MNFRKMRKKYFCKLLLLLILGLVMVVIYSKSVSSLRNLGYTSHAHIYRKGNDTLESIPENKVEKTVKQERIVISFVVCNTRFNESLNVVKSVIIFTKSPVLFVIFTDDNLWTKFNKTLSNWREITNKKFEFELQQIKFPEAHKEDWLNLFSKCAAQRLFIPKLLAHIDSMIYVDTDTVFLGPAEQLWQYFHQFNSSQISAMTLEDDNPNISWYPRFAKHPFYGKYGLNSGVMLMNLTRMRDFGWVDYVTPIMLQWKLNIPWGDQDIINIIFHYQPRAVLELPCRANFRSDQCMYGAACSGAAAGVLLLHGSRGVFHQDKQPAFKAVYRAIDEHAVGREPPRLVVERLARYLGAAPPSHCAGMKDAFLKLARESLAGGSASVPAGGTSFG